MLVFKLIIFRERITVIKNQTKTSIENYSEIF